MDSIINAINEYRIIVGALVLTLVAALLLHFYWSKVSFFVLRMRMNAPFIGKINRLAKNPSRDESDWFHSEKDLCSEFQPYYETLDKGPEYYDNCKNYLRKVTELGRKNLGLFGWLAISIMVFIEAMGFSYVLAGFTIPGASESIQQQGAIGIALLISGLLVALTHHTGHELHKNGLVNKIRVWWRQSKNQPPLEPNANVQLEKDTVDDDDPAWRLILSRVDTNAEVKPSYKITISTMIFVIAVATGSTYVRGQVLEKDALDAHNDFNPAQSEVGDPYASQIPPDLVQSQNETDAAVSDQIKDATLAGGWATFIVLAVIFVFLQILGVLIGYKTGFAGKESNTAFKFSHKFKTRNEFEAYHERKRELVSQIAQRNLTKLQARMAHKLSLTATDSGMLRTLEGGNGRSFLAYNRKISNDQHQHYAEEAASRRSRQSQIHQNSSIQPHLNATNAAVAYSDSQDLDEADIKHWMEKLGWDRDRTIDLLIQQRQNKKVEQNPGVSEEEALRMMEEANQ